MYYVYMHTVPNGKVYVGETKDPVRRWANGEGYSDNKDFYKDIILYGWNNIKHEIIGQFETEIEARVCEAIMIFHLDSETQGYNQTTIKKDTLNMYATRQQTDAVSINEEDTRKNIFELSGLPISACQEMIEQWVFNEKYRRILKDRLINGKTYPELSQQYKISVRQLKTIVYDCSKELEKHLNI